MCSAMCSNLRPIFWVVGYLYRFNKKGGHGGCCGSHFFREAFHNFGGFDRCDLTPPPVPRKIGILSSAEMHFWMFIPEARKGRP